jgi:hypothetical protein
MGKNIRPSILDDKTGQFIGFQNPPSCLPLVYQVWYLYKIQLVFAENTRTVIQQARGERIPTAHGKSCYRPLSPGKRSLADYAPPSIVCGRSIPSNLKLFKLFMRNSE